MAGSRTLKLSILAETADLVRGLDSASKETQTFGDKVEAGFSKVGKAAALAGAAVVALAGKLAIDGVKAAIEDEAAQAKLAKTLENVTNATKNQIEAVEQYITQASLAKGVTDDELRPAFDRIIRTVKDTDEAQKLLNLAMDISAGTGKSLQSVAEALSKAYDGNLNALRKLGIKTQEIVPDTKAQENATRGVERAQLAYNQAIEKYGELSPQAEKAALTLRQAKEKLGEAVNKTAKQTLDFDVILASLSGTFEGQADIAANTYQGRMERLKIAFNEAKESIGAALLPSLGNLTNFLLNQGVPALNSFINGLTGKSGVKIALGETSPRVVEMNTRLTDIEKIAKDLGTTIRNVGSRFADLFAIFDTATGGEGSATKGLEKALKALNTVAEATGKIFEVIQFTVEGIVQGFKDIVSFGTKAKDFLGKINPFDNFRQSSMSVPTVTTPNTANLGMASSSPNYITVNGAIDPEGTARTIINVLNNSQGRGTLGAGALAF